MCAHRHGEPTTARKERCRRVWLHRLGTDPDNADVLVFGADADPAAVFRVSVDQDRWLIVTTASGASRQNDVHLADLTESLPDRPVFRPVQSGLAASTAAQVCQDGLLYLRTTYRAPLHQLSLRTPPIPTRAGGGN